MIWLAVISTLAFDRCMSPDCKGYQTTFIETRSATSCEKVVRTAIALRPGKVVGRCIRLD